MTEHNLPTFTIRPKKVTSFLLSITFLLLTAYAFVLVRKYIFQAQAGGHTFDLDQEGNVPAFFSTGLFLINSALFFLLWKMRDFVDGSRRIWLFLAGLLCFLGLDELASIHERLIKPVKSLIPASGWFYYAWIIPYGLALIVLAGFILPILWKLDRPTRSGFLLSAVVFVSGAIGFEMIAGQYMDGKTETDLIYGLLVGCEEILEMIGLIILVNTTLQRIQRKYRGFVVSMAGSKSPSIPKIYHMPQ